ncbi:hypothetical protein BK022_00165 [Methylorubrum extorquens]|uniref:Uncharacterized protein n=1 Tax=Methylorubrum extorquens TaxID=408 RepID=A0A1S1PAZ4_METEX|nr:hypothetical protein BK022_00165 [Methylorubrum extorquens]
MPPPILSQQQPPFLPLMVAWFIAMPPLAHMPALPLLPPQQLMASAGAGLSRSKAVALAIRVFMGWFPPEDAFRL